MSVDKLLQKYQSNPTDEPADQDQIEDQGAYGLLRAPRERAIMLELRKKDGTIFAFPYSLIENIQFKSADVITIHASGREIRITGKNLNQSNQSRISLLNGLTRNRIVWVQEYSRTVASEPKNDAIQIELITF